MYVQKLVLLLAVGAAAVMLAATPGLAQNDQTARVKPPKSYPIDPITGYPIPPNRKLVSNRAPAKVTVTRRSYLDPGTAQKYPLQRALSRLRLPAGQRVERVLRPDRLEGELPQPDAVSQLLRPAGILQVIATGGAPVSPGQRTRPLPPPLAGEGWGGGSRSESGEDRPLRPSPASGRGKSRTRPKQRAAPSRRSRQRPFPRFPPPSRPPI